MLLSVYFRAFREELKNAKNLIIWGQSLKNDPHIEEDIKRKFCIRNYFIKRNIIIVDTNEQHKIRDLCKGKDINIKFINPNDFNDLQNLFDKIYEKYDIT